MLHPTDDGLSVTNCFIRGKRCREKYVYYLYGFFLDNHPFDSRHNNYPVQNAQ